MYSSSRNNDRLHFPSNQDEDIDSLYVRNMYAMPWISANFFVDNTTTLDNSIVPDTLDAAYIHTTSRNGSGGRRPVQPQASNVVTSSDTQHGPVSSLSSSSLQPTIEHTPPSDITASLADTSTQTPEGPPRTRRVPPSPKVSCTAGCGKTFSRRKDMERHVASVRAHGFEFGVRQRHPCTICQKVCSRKDVLKRHMAQVHGECSSARPKKGCEVPR